MSGQNLIPETGYQNLAEDSMERKVIDTLTEFYTNFAKFALEHLIINHEKTLRGFRYLFRIFFFVEIHCQMPSPLNFKREIAPKTLHIIILTLLIMVSK